MPRRRWYGALLGGSPVAGEWVVRTVCRGLVGGTADVNAEVRAGVPPAAGDRHVLVGMGTGRIAFSKDLGVVRRLVAVSL